MYNTHLIYYDENIDYGSENYGYVSSFKNKIKGAFFPIKNIDTLKKVVNKLSSLDINKFTLVTSGRAAEKVIPICSNIIDRVIIFCFYVDKYIPLKSKYSKIKSVLNDFSSIFDNLSSNNSVLKDSKIIQSKFITFDDYKNNYISFHKSLAYFFNTNYYQMEYSSSYRNNFINFINKSDVDDKNYAIKLINDVKTGSVKEFIEAYTGENVLCYRLNRWLRNCDANEYEKVKYFAGPFSYALYRYAYNNKNQGIYKSKTFYRKMTIKLSDFLLYKIYTGELICYPAFTSTSEEDMTKYNFPTSTAISVNQLTPSDVSVVLIIKYNCSNSSNATPCVNAVEFSVNAGEREFIFPPFSFFKIENVVEKSGIPDDPHMIYMSVPNKKSLLEFGLKNNKSIYYNNNGNELYYS
jgi:hypothetical protein